MPRGGKYRRVVSITQPALAVDGMGTPQPTWSTYIAKLFADIDESSGKESIQAGQIDAKQPVMVSIRYSSQAAGITPKMRVVYGTRTFEIMSTANMRERNREIELTCVERE